MCEIHIFENAKNNSHRVYCDGIGFLILWLLMFKRKWIITFISKTVPVIYTQYTYIECTGVFKEIKIKALLFYALYKQYIKLNEFINNMLILNEVQG